MKRNALLFAALSIPTGRPSIEIRGFHMVQSKEQKKHLEMDSSFARIFKPEDIIVLDAPKAKLWSSGPRPYDIQGDFGIISSAQEDFTILASSLVKGPDGMIFKTSNLVFNSKKQLMETPDYVEATQINSRGKENIKITGMGLNIQLETNTYMILDNVKATQLNESNSSLVILSESAEFAPRDYRASFKNDVSVNSKQFTLKGEVLDIAFAKNKTQGLRPEEPTQLIIEEMIFKNDNKKNSKLVEATFSDLSIKSKGLVVKLDAKGELESSHAIGSATGKTQDGVSLKSDELISENLITGNRIRLTGHVTILTNSRVATCQDADFFPESGDIILRQTAAVQKEDQLIEGELIRFSTKHSEITVERAKGSLPKPKPKSKKQ